MKITYGVFAVYVALLFWAPPALADTTDPPNLTITQYGKTIKTVPVFDKWTDGATLAVGDLGTDGTPELVVGAGPGSVPEILVLRQDGTLIHKFNAFDKTMPKGVIVSVGDINNDGVNEIVAATGPKHSDFVRVFNGYGKLLNDWFPGPDGLNMVFTAATIPKKAMGFFVPAPRFENFHEEIPKRIEIDLKKQRLYIYENGYLLNTFLVSTGLPSMPTKTGNYSVLRKIPNKAYNTLKNVHWNLLIYPAHFIHEAYWHNKFGTQQSHGCINMRLADSKIVYDWAPIGTPVLIY